MRGSVALPSGQSGLGLSSTSALTTLKKLNERQLNAKYNELMKHKYDFDDPYTTDKLLDDRLMKGAKYQIAALYKDEPDLPYSLPDEHGAEEGTHGLKAPTAEDAGDAPASDGSLPKAAE